MSFRSILFLGILILGGMASGILIFWSSPLIETPLKITARDKQNFRALDFQASHFNLAGQLQHHIEGREMKGDSLTNTVTITAPQIKFNNKDQTNITVSSDQAMWDREAQHLVFTGKVNAIQTSTPSVSPPSATNVIAQQPSAPLSLTASVLQWDKNKVSSPAPLSLETDNASIKAGRMEADQALSQVQFSQGIHILWRPTPASTPTPP